MEYIFAEGNGREITGKDKIFGISQLAKKAVEKYGKDKVVNATIGALLDDDGELIVLSSMVDVLKSMTPQEFAEYAPIAGTTEYLNVIKTVVFGNFMPEGYIEACATPGGTGSIRNVISNYSRPGDRVLTSNWHWKMCIRDSVYIERAGKASVCDMKLNSLESFLKGGEEIAEAAERSGDR